MFLLFRFVAHAASATSCTWIAEELMNDFKTGFEKKFLDHKKAVLDAIAEEKKEREGQESDTGAEQEGPTMISKDDSQTAAVGSMKPRWADLEDSDEEEAIRPIASVEMEVDNLRESLIRNDANHFCRMRGRVSLACTERHCGASGKMHGSHRLSDRHLEGGCSVPPTRTRDMEQGGLHGRRIRPSSDGIGRRRSVECLCLSRAYTDSYVQACTCVHAPLTHAYKHCHCFHVCVKTSVAQQLSRCASAQADKR